jgi:hypothetical protein
MILRRKHIITSLDLTENLVAYYKLDGPPGAVIDSSINSFDRINFGATRGVIGKVDEAFSFDGESEYVRSDDFIPFVGEGSMSIWAKCSNILPGDVLQILFLHGTTEVIGADNPTVYIAQRTTGKYDIRFVGNASNNFIGIADVAVNTFEHLVFTWGNSRMRFYINADLKFEATGLDLGFLAADKNLFIGRYGHVNQYRYGGTLDEAKLFSKELTEKEIIQDYQYGLNGLPLK